MKTPIPSGGRKKLPFFSFGGARSTSNSNPNTPGPGPQNSENSAPVGAGAGASSTVLRGSETDDEWYIPYKGPYELPSSPSSAGHHQGLQRAHSTSSSNILPGRYRGAAMASSLRRSRSRDSWGDPIYPTYDSAADGSGYAYDNARATSPATGAELERGGRSRAGRDRDSDSDRGNKEDGNQGRTRTRRSASLTVTISKSRLPGFNAARVDIINDGAGGSAVNAQVKGKGTGTGKYEEREIEDKDPSHRHRHRHRPVLISQSPTAPMGPQSSPSRDTHTHRRRPSTAPPSPTRFLFSPGRPGPVDPISRSPSPSPSPAAPVPAPASPKRSRSRPETGTGLLSLPGLGLGLDTITHNRRRSTVSSGTGAGIFARPPSSTSSGFASASASSGSGRARNRTGHATLSYINLDAGAMGGVGESPVPAYGGSRSRPPMGKDGKVLDLSSLFVPTHKLFKKLSKLGLGSGEGRKKEEREEKAREKVKERGRRGKGAATGLRSHGPSSQPRARSHSRPVLRIHPPASGGGAGKQDRAYRQGQRTEALATTTSPVSPLSAEQPHLNSGDQAALRLNPHMHSRHRSRSLPLPRAPPSQPQPPPPPSHANNHTHTHTRAHDLHARRSPEPDFEPEQPRLHLPNPHPHLNINIPHSYSHSLSTYASTSTAIATQPSLGTNPKPSPSSSAGGGGAPSGVGNDPGNGLEIEETERGEGDGEENGEEEDEEGYAYALGFGGGGRVGYGLQSSSSAASSVADESPDPAGGKRAYVFGHSLPGRGGGGLGSSHPYARASFLSQHTAGDGNDGFGAGTKWVGMTTRQAQVGRLSPIPSGPSLPSVSVLSVGAAGGGTSGAASVGASVGGGGAAGGSDTWDKASGTGERTMLRNSISTPDLRFAGIAGVDEHMLVHEQKQGADEDGESTSGSGRMKVRVWSRFGGSSSFKEREKKAKEKDKEGRWLSTQSPYAFLLPRPRFRVKTLETGERPEPGGSGTAQSGSQSLPNVSRSRSLLDLEGGIGGGGDEENAAKVPIVKQEQGIVKFGEGSRRKSYARDDLSLLSLDKVLEERERLEKDRKIWQAHAVKSLGNKQSRAVSRSRSKSLTLAGRMMNSSLTKGNLTQQQSNIDYLTARACVGDQDFSPLMEYNEDGPWLAQRQKEKGANKHSRQPSASTSSGAATTSVGVVTSEGQLSVKGHQRNDSWSRSAIKIARSLPQMCGIMRDSTEEQLKNGNDEQRLEEALKREDTKVIRLVDPAADSLSGSGDQRMGGGSSSPVPSGISDGGVGIAISTPPISESQGPSYVLPDHPYAFGADRPEDRVRAELTGQGLDADLPIRIPAHPYAHGGLPTGGTPEYAGRHPTSHPSHLLASLGLSEVSARHRLPPQLIVGQHQSSSIRGVDDPPNREQGRQPLYVRVDSRNSYQDLWPYVRVDSDIAPHEKLWVTYSPGVVREVLPNEVFQYSPREERQGNLPASSLAASSKEGASRRDQPDDLFLRRYQRMSTVYQDTAAMADAMYDAFNQRASTVVEPRHSSISESAVDDDEEAVEDEAHIREDLVESVSQPRQEFAQNVIDPHYQRHLRVPEPGRVAGPSSSSKNLGVSPLMPDPSPVEYHPFGTTLVTRFAPNTSKETSTYSSPVTPSVPRISSPNNLEPFHDLFYKPPFDSESDSHSSPQEEPYDDDNSPPLENVPWDVGSSNSQRTGSGLTSLVRQLGDELEQMALDRQGFSDGYSQDSNIPDIPPRTSSLGRLGVQSGPINSEVGPLHFLFQNSPQQELRRPYNMARPGRFSAFDPANTIPEDVELSENPLSDEKPEDDTVVTVDPALTPMSSRFNYTSQPLYGRETNQSEEHLPAEPLGSSRRQSFDALRASHLTTSTLSRMSALSEFPDPPETTMSEHMSVLSSYADDNTIT